MFTGRFFAYHLFRLLDFLLKNANVESTDQCNTCVKTSYFDHFLVGNYETHETVVHKARQGFNF